RAPSRASSRRPPDPRPLEAFRLEGLEPEVREAELVLERRLHQAEDLARAPNVVAGLVRVALVERHDRGLDERERPLEVLLRERDAGHGIASLTTIGIFRGRPTFRFTGTSASMSRSRSRRSRTASS